MSNIVKFPGDGEESIPDNLVRFATKAEREAMAELLTEKKQA